MYRPSRPFNAECLKEASGLRRFIPPIIYQRAGFASQIEHEVAAMFIDVAGFTQLSESLAARGAEGAECLESMISQYFNAFLDEIERYDGYPVKISGDALTVLFPKKGDELRDATLRAVACARAVRRIGMAVARVELPNETVHMAHKIGVGCGHMLTSPIGDPRLRSEFVFAGSALEQAVAAEHHAKPGEVWVSPQVATLLALSSAWHADPQRGFCRLKMSARLGLKGRARVSEVRLDLSPEDLETVAQRYASLIPATVQEYAGEGALNYLCRHQKLVAMFVGCPSLLLDRADSMIQLDAHYRHMQQIIEQYGGFLSEFEAGDKGAKIIVLFGAPTTQEDPCGQAVRCAQAMQQTARELGIVTDQRIGITTGQLYVGQIGCRSLVKYSAIGDRMNLAARLMSAAGRWEVLAEQRVVQRAHQTARWGTPYGLRVKGKSEEVVIQSMLLARVQPGRDRRGRGLIGRASERNACLRRIGKLLEGYGGVIEITGPGGMGKTRLAGVIGRLALEHGIRRVVQWGDGARGMRASPFTPLRPLLLDLMDAHPQMSPAELQEKFEAWFSRLPADLRNAAGLAATTIGVSCDLDPRLLHLPPDRLLALRQRSMADLIAHAATTAPRLFLLDNAEQLDDPSVAVLTELAPLLDELPLLFVLAHRPPTVRAGDPFRSLRAYPSVSTITLGALAAPDAARLACRRLKVAQLDSELDRVLQERANGHPMLVEAWIDFLRYHGQIQVRDGVAFMSGTRRMEDMPDQLEALILTQLDQLPPGAQLTVRVASIVGLYITPASVAALHPQQITEAVAARHLHLAAQADLIWYERGAPSRMFFNRQEVLDTIHDSLPFYLRRELHAIRARQLLESLSGQPDGDTVLQLAHHYEYIEQPSDQCKHFRRATQTCSERYDHRGTVLWARKWISIGDRLHDRMEYLEAAPLLQDALGMLGEPEERQEVLQRWLKEAEAATDDNRLVEALQANAFARERIGDGDGALADLERVLQIVRSSGNLSLLIDTLYRTATVYVGLGRADYALELAREAGDVPFPHSAEQTAGIIHSRGYALLALGRTEETQADFLRALKDYETTGDLWHQASILINLGVVHYYRGQLLKSRMYFERALEINSLVGDRAQIGRTMANLGMLCLLMGEVARARSYTRDAARIADRQKDLNGELVAQLNLAEIARTARMQGEAERALSRAESLVASSSNAMHRIETWLQGGELALSSGQLVRAQTFFERAYQEASAIGNDGFKCNSLEGLAELASLRGEVSLAGELIVDAVRILESDERAVTLPQRVWWRAWRFLSSAGRADEARACLQLARAHIEHLQRELGSSSARRRFSQAFPWNREIMRGKSCLRLTSRLDRIPLPGELSTH